MNITLIWRGLLFIILLCATLDTFLIGYLQSSFSTISFLLFVLQLTECMECCLTQCNAEMHKAIFFQLIFYENFKLRRRNQRNLEIWNYVHWSLSLLENTKHERQGIKFVLVIFSFICELWYWLCCSDNLPMNRVARGLTTDSKWA